MHVLIVGAGLGGVMLGGLLEKAGISYQVFEKAAEAKPLGSAMSVGPHILPVFKQLGVYDEIMRHARPCLKATLVTHPEDKVWSDEYTFFKERYGDYIHIIDRPKLYEIMSSLVPKDKILCDKKVLTMEQNVEGVMIRCHDNTNYHGDVLVGADGAYSAVRQALYDRLRDKGVLPKEDDTKPPFNTVSLVGVTNPMPPGTFETIEGECRYGTMLYKKAPYLTALFSKPNGGVKWMISQNVGDYKTRDDEHIRNADWGTEGAWAMAEQVRHLPSPFGPTLGTFFDNTPRDGISKVMLEEKLYKTWHHERTVLLGDACHKFYPTTGQGAINAMMDAVVLANVLHACPTDNIVDIRRCLDAYRNERFLYVEAAYDASSKGSYLSKPTFMGDIVRFLYFHIYPASLRIAAFDEMYCTHRPQAAFLPLVPPQGSRKPSPQTNYDYLKTPVPSSVIV